MNFLADESVDRQIVDRLRRDGHFVLYAVEMEPGISDDAVLNLANKESAVLLTSDKDFGEMVFRQGQSNQGVILVRVAGLSQKSKSEIVGSAIKEHASELAKAFTVITPKAIRIRRHLPTHKI
jgi:predicted nuclease of predicted toxin-antitoxin system